MILLPSLHLLATLIHAIMVSFNISEVQDCTIYEEHMVKQRDWALSDNLKCSLKCYFEVQMTRINKRNWD
jgi:hypothetical protein